MGFARMGFKIFVSGAAGLFITAFNAALSGAIVATAGFAAQAQAQAYPNKAVRLVIPFAPGGGAELQARIVAQKLTELWGKPVVLDNKPGAGTTIAAAHVAKADPDGYTIYAVYPSHVISASLYRDLPYDALSSFIPISLTQSAAYVLIVPASSRYRTAKDLVDAARAAPGKLNYGSSGIGAGPHMAGELFSGAANISAVHIPYKGTGQMLTAFLGGQLDFGMGDPASRPVIASGKARALAVSTPVRWSPLPDVPTMAEAGFNGAEITNWSVILAPAGTPRPVVEAVNAALRRVLQDADLQKRFAENGYDVIGSTPEEAARFMAGEHSKYAKLVKQLGLKPE